MADTIRILIVDDEQLARQKIMRYLRSVEEEEALEIVEAENGLVALEIVKAFTPAIVFLDIQMPGLNGFEFMYHQEDRTFQVIFQTAYDEFALKAFEESACDYILKPFSRPRFLQAYYRAKNAVLDQTKLRQLERALTTRNNYMSRIGVSHRGEKLILDIDDIDCFISRDHSTCLHVGNLEYITSVSLRRLIQVLDPSKFLRIHRTSIVNIASISGVARGSEAQITLRNGMTLPLSRRCQPGVKNIAGLSAIGLR